VPPVTADLQPFVDQLINRSRLNETEQRAVLELPSDELQVSANRDIVRLDQTVDHVSVVVKGVVARFGQTADGERQITALHIAGDAPDLHTVVVPDDTVPLQALTTTTILRVPHAALRAVAARYPAVAEAFWRHTSVDAAITAKWVLNVGRHDAQTRIAHLLCEMAVRCKANVGRGEVTFPFPLTQTQLGDCIGMTPVHVNRSLKKLAAAGIVTLAGRTARIPDWERLFERGEFEAGYLQAGLQPCQRLRIVD
jgi:CRP-like cAMP-binding protein